MLNFVYLLKLLATALITNSHYASIWPISSMATGGLLGNVIFFAVSGFCLYRINSGFVAWYSKRFLRIYPVMAAFTLFAVILGKYPISGWPDFVGLFIFPTNYVFVVWILLLYIPFYFVVKAEEKHNGFLKWTLVAIGVVWILVYVIFFDKSYYHIDDVNSPYIVFLYFASMLIGALFNKHKDKFEKSQIKDLFIVAVSLVLYFGSKLIFSSRENISFLQPVNQIAIIAALISIFAFAMGLEAFISKLNKKMLLLIKFIASITLQIYIVQFLIIDKFKSLVFPLNLIAVTVMIIVSAAVLYYVEHFIRKGMTTIFKKKSNNVAEG